VKKLVLLLLTLGFSITLAQSAQDTYIEQNFAEIDTLDPVQAYDSASGQVIENVYEGLYGYEGDSVTEYKPLLATDYTASDDNMTYTFTLREGVAFHSGNAFSCKDVEYSYQRALVVNPPDSGSWILMEPLTGYYSDANTELGEGATDQQYADLYATIDGSVECPDGPDGLTVVFNLAQEDPAFFAKTLFYAAAIVDMQWAVDNGMWDGTEATWRDWIGVDLREHFLQSNMSGTGAYKLVNWAVGDRTIAEANESYWGGAPAIKNVQLQLVEDTAARILALQQGDADFVSLTRSNLGQVQGSPGVLVQDAATDPELGWSSVTVGAVFLNQNVVTENNDNVGSGQLDGNGIPADFFTDINVRKCFNYAFDYDAYISQVLQGQGAQLTMALPPSYLGYDPEAPTYNFDMAAAQEACQAAWDGQVWETGFELTIAYNTGSEDRQAVAEILKGNLEFLNPKFRINVRNIAWPDYLDQRGQNLLPVSVVGWIPDYADPDNYVHTFYAEGGYYADQSSFANEEITALDQQARTSFDEATRVDLYSQIAQLGYEQAPFVLLPQGVPFLVTRDNLQGTYINPMYSGSYLWKDLSKS
jgi:peptide/nickel transport system substrate-binding protein